MNPILLNLPMPILTPRLQIRPRQIGEGKVICEAVTESIDILRPWMPFAQAEPKVENFEEHARKALAEFILRNNFTLSIYDREGKNFIGSTGFHFPNWDLPSFHIGYWVRKSCQGQGYIQESTNALTRYAFSVFKAKRIEIRCHSKNLRSLAVMTKLGFQQEGILRSDELDEAGLARDTIITSRIDLKGLPELDVSWK